MTDHVSMSWSDEATENFGDLVMKMRGWYVRLTTQDGREIEAEIVDNWARETVHGGEAFFDEVVYREVDPETGLAPDNAPLERVRVSNVHVY